LDYGEIGLELLESSNCINCFLGAREIRFELQESINCFLGAREIGFELLESTKYCLGAREIGFELLESTKYCLGAREIGFELLESTNCCLGAREIGFELLESTNCCLHGWGSLFRPLFGCYSILLNLYQAASMRRLPLVARIPSWSALRPYREYGRQRLLH